MELMHLIAVLKTICIQEFSTLYLNILHWSGWLLACRERPTSKANTGFWVK